MSSSNSKLSDLHATTYYHPIPTDPPPPPPPQYVVVLPYSPTPPSTCTLLYRSCRRYFLCFSILLLLTSAVYLLYPSDPDVSIVRLHLDRLKLHTFPISLDITLDLTVKLQNKDFYSIDYNYLRVSISYRGKQLGFVKSDHGHVQARASSYINATLQLDGVEIFSDVIPLIEDLAKGSITFDTVTEINGQLGLFFFEIPLKVDYTFNRPQLIETVFQATVACEIVVDTENQTVSHQNCYPEIKPENASSFEAETREQQSEP